MAQNRDAPAYQEYAASILAQITFRTMTLQDRGLFCTMRFECWVNKRLPANPNLLAKVLGLSSTQVTASLPAVMPFFRIDDGYIISPELEDYRAHLADRKSKQSEGGKRGSAKTNSSHKAKNKSEDIADAGDPPGNSQVSCQGGGECSAKSNAEEPSQTQSIRLRGTYDQFVKEYEAEEKCSAHTYDRMSNGG